MSYQDIGALIITEIVGDFDAMNNLWRRIDYIQYRTGLFIAPQSEKQYCEVDGDSEYDYTKIFHTLLHPRSSCHFLLFFRHFVFFYELLN
jgi:hypothetical protein